MGDGGLAISDCFSCLVCVGWNTGQKWKHKTCFKRWGERVATEGEKNQTPDYLI